MFYDRVWERPVQAVATELAISGVALGKICRGLGVPVPGRGYWALKVGRAPDRPPLPSMSEETAAHLAATC